LGAEVVRGHLTGNSTVGLYPLLRDDTCWLLAIDFDKESWHNDVLAVADACDALGIPSAVERSRSGDGAHLWTFFASPVAASLARNLGSVVVTRTLDRRYQIGFDSYDRLFPSQDTLPTRGFGNLISLPLQEETRRQGNTVFLDGSLEPFPDQWRFLPSIHRLEPSAVEPIVRDAARAGRVLGLGPSWFEEDEEPQPWTLPPSHRRKSEVPMRGLLLSSVNVVLANRPFIPKDGLPPLLINQLRRLATIQNPEFYRAQARRMSTREKPRLIDCSEDFQEHLALPRGCLIEVRKPFEHSATSVGLRDERCGGAPISAKFDGALSMEQAEVAAALAQHELGVLSAPTAFGKTVIGA